MEFAQGVDLRRYVRAEPAATAGKPLRRLRADPRRARVPGSTARHRPPRSQAVEHHGLRRAGHVKILDFGLAGAADTPDFSDAMLAGTPTYMCARADRRAPARSRAAISTRSARSSTRCSCGEPPFGGPQRQVLNAQRYQHPLPPSDRVEGVPPDLELWCLRLLAKRPEERFASPRAARQALEECGAPPTPTRHRAREWRLEPVSRAAPTAASSAATAERAHARRAPRRRADGECHMALISGESGIGKTRARRGDPRRGARRRLHRPPRRLPRARVGHLQRLRSGRRRRRAAARAQRCRRACSSRRSSPRPSATISRCWRASFRCCAS